MPDILEKGQFRTVRRNIVGGLMGTGETEIFELLRRYQRDGQIFWIVRDLNPQKPTAEVTEAWISYGTRPFWATFPLRLGFSAAQGREYADLSVDAGDRLIWQYSGGFTPNRQVLTMPDSYPLQRGGAGG